MQEKFISYITENKLISLKQKTLLAVSGGRDSVVLCELYHQAQLPFAIAHCNFNLRAEESDAEEVFVNQLAKKYEVEIFVKNCDTKAYAEKNKISIQMAARELRFSWFEELFKQYDFKFYAAAHHKDDSVETYLINQIRGTGLSGLHGIQPQNIHLIHPLLFASRSDIDEFIKKNSLDFREDSSNTSIKYLRNKIRHQIMPVLEEINPNIQEVFEQNIHRFSETEKMMEYLMDHFRKENCYVKDEELIIQTEALLKLPFASTLLFELIKAYGFSYTQAQQLIQSEQQHSGALMYSKTYQLLRNRAQYIIRKQGDKDIQSVFFEVRENGKNISHPFHMSCEVKRQWQILRDDETAQIDYNKLSSTLELRKWKQGDYFYPLGMKGRKKMLSDFFIDLKLNLFEKEELWLLCSDNKIVWVVGYRIDDRYKITKSTEKILELKILTPPI